MEGTPFARHASKRPRGTLEGVPETKVGWSTGRFGMASRSLSFCDFTQRESRRKEAMGLEAWVRPICKACGAEGEGVRWRRRRIRHTTQACSPPRLRSLEPAKHAAVMFSVQSAKLFGGEMPCRSTSRVGVSLRTP